MTAATHYTGADVVCPNCHHRVAGARLTFRSVAEREAVVVSAETGVPVERLLRHDGTRKHARARWGLWVRLRDGHSWPNNRIARICGGVDPVTVLKAFQTLEREREKAGAA